MKRYEYVLLDWDGNLAKTLDMWLKACRVPLVNRGFKLSDEEIAASFGALKTYFDMWGITDHDEYIREMDEAAAEMLPYVELYPDALEVLEALKSKGIKTALITTSPHQNIAHVLERYNMNRLFDVLVTHHDTENHKPHPEPLEKALAELGGTKELAIMVGDTDKDLGAAANFGIDSMLFYPPEHEKFYPLEKLKGYNPTYVFDDFKKLLELV